MKFSNNKRDYKKKRWRKRGEEKKDLKRFF